MIHWLHAKIVVVYGGHGNIPIRFKGVTSITYTTPEVNGMFNGWWKL